MRYRSRLLIALAALILAFGAAACGDDDGDGEGAGTTAAPTTHTVDVDDNFFEPELLEVSVGDTVSWEWVGVEPHNVVGDDFESDIQQEGTFEYTFDETGTYEYTCTVHPGMDGVVEVS